MKFFAIFFIVLFVFSCGRGTEATTKQKVPQEQDSESRYKQDMDDLKKSMKSDVRIKLKKDGKGGYSWEITGKDAQEVLKANDTLRKRLND